MNNIKVLMGGSPYHANLLADEVESYGHGFTAKAEQPLPPMNVKRKVIPIRKAIPQLIKADIYHGTYWDDCYKIFFTAKLMGKKTVCHWIGTDVFDIMRDKKRQAAMKILDKVIDIHLAGSPGLIEELKTLNIDAKWVPIIPPDFKTQVYPFPSSVSVLAYIPGNRPDFYKFPVVRQLAVHFPDVKFLVVGSKEAEPDSPGNITYLGFQKNIDEIYKQASVLMRIVEHDGLSLMILEAMARGRQIIWSEKLPHCYHARDFETAKVALSSILNNPLVNADGAKYVQDTFNTDKVLGGLNEIYLKILGKRK